MTGVQTCALPISAEGDAGPAVIVVAGQNEEVDATQALVCRPKISEVKRAGVDESASAVSGFLVTVTGVSRAVDADRLVLLGSIIHDQAVEPGGAAAVLDAQIEDGLFYVFGYGSNQDLVVPFPCSHESLGTMLCLFVYGNADMQLGC